MHEFHGFWCEGFFPESIFEVLRLKPVETSKQKEETVAESRTFLSDLEIRLFFSCLEHLFFATPTKIHFEVEQQRNRDLS